MSQNYFRPIPWKKKPFLIHMWMAVWTLTWVKEMQSTLSNLYTVLSNHVRWASGGCRLHYSLMVEIEWTVEEPLRWMTSIHIQKGWSFSPVAGTAIFIFMTSPPKWHYCPYTPLCTMLPVPQGILNLYIFSPIIFLIYPIQISLAWKVCGPVQ